MGYEVSQDGRFRMCATDRYPAIEIEPNGRDNMRLFYDGKLRVMPKQRLIEEAWGCDE